MKGLGAYTLFVTLPNKTTHSVRRLSKNVRVSEVKVRLEIEAGIPSHAYVVFFGQAQLNDTDVIEFRAGVKNGVLLRACLTEEWHGVYSAVLNENTEDVVDVCRKRNTFDTIREEENIELEKEHGDKSEEQLDILDGERTVTALYMASFNGSLGIVRKLLEIAGPDAPALVLLAMNENGRCSLHAGAAGDQVQVLEELLAYRVSATIVDGEGCSPADVATENGAYIAERFLRSHILKRKGMSRAMSSISRTINTRPSSARPASSSAQPASSSHNNQLTDTALSKHDALSKHNAPSNQQPDSATVILGQSSRTLPFKTTSQNHVEKQPSSAEIHQNKKTNRINRTDKLNRPDRPKMHTVTVPLHKEQENNGPPNSLPKRKPRIKSAPMQMQLNGGLADRRRNHGSCSSTRPFMAYRSVPQEELRAETVEFVPLTPGRFLGQDQRSQDRQVRTQMASDIPHAPCSSLNTSLEDVSVNDLPPSPQLVPTKTSTLPLDTSRVSLVPPDASRVSGVFNAGGDAASGSRSTVFHWKPPCGGGVGAISQVVGSEKTVTWMDNSNNTNGRALSRDGPRKVVSKQELAKEYTRPAGTGTARAQSARYYRSKYHDAAEEEKYYQTIPRPRPASAGPRYRAWKEWLLQKYEEDAAASLKEKENAPRRARCERAFNRWLKKKYKELEEQSDSSDSDDYSDHEEENNAAFDKWLESKQSYFLEQKKNGGKTPGPAHKMAVFQIGCTDKTLSHPEDFNSYMRVHHKWYAKKEKYENWKKRNEAKNEVKTHAQEESKWTPEELAEMRRHLVLQGCTYEEWMGMKSRERKTAAHLHVTAFGDTSPRKFVLSKPEKSDTSSKKW